LLQPGALWESIRFATPLDAAGTMAVARLPKAASAQLRGARLWVALGVLAADVAIFTAFGAYLLRRRVVLPLQGLAGAAGALARGDLEARVPEQGTRETVEVARAFNDMSAALARRTGALEKAIADLRSSNAELRRARAGLDRAERLASVGRLAAGVAHEVGNPIAAMLAFLDLVSRDAGIGEASRGHLARAAREGERVRRILRQLLDFSRPSRGAPGPMDLEAAARETLALVEAQHRYRDVVFGLEVVPPVPPAWADTSAVAQILLNLVLNAADAALESEVSRVELRITAGPLRSRAGEGVDSAQGRRRPDGVECCVCDTGPGIRDEDRDRIFDPFFTTKPPGQGTGLGLANALRLAEEQDGEVALVEAPEGTRTAFALRLPTAASSGARARLPATADTAGDCAVRNALRSGDPDPDLPA
jgi:signal transduction histidine kinase